MPAGMSTEKLLVVRTRPRPRHSGHGSDGTSPVPRHCGQVWARTNWPNGPRLTWRTWPWPSHMAQRVMSAPGAAPEPSQLGHSPTVSYSTVRVVPWADSTNEISTATPTSSPAAGPARRPKTSPPKKASNRSWKEPKSAKSGPAWRPRSPSAP